MKDEKVLLDELVGLLLLTQPCHHLEDVGGQPVERYAETLSPVLEQRPSVGADERFPVLRLQAFRHDKQRGQPAHSLPAAHTPEGGLHPAFQSWIDEILDVLSLLNSHFYLFFYYFCCFTFVKPIKHLFSSLYKCKANRIFLLYARFLKEIFKFMQGKDIIGLILNDLGIKAPTFANSIGLKYQRILDIQSGKTKKISPIVADAIIEKYPQYSKIWLLTGEGSRIREDKSANVLGNNNGINNSGTINMSHSTIDNRSYYSDSPDVLRAEIDRLDQIIETKEGIIKSQEERIKSQEERIKSQEERIDKLLDIIAKK